jgi:hypothetical protein
VQGRGLDDPGEQCGLGDRELGGGGVEVGPRRGLDPVGAVAELDEVEVPGENLVLGVVPVEIDGHLHLAELAGEGGFGGGGALVIVVGLDEQEVVLDVLLVECRGALGHAAAGEVGGQGSGGAAQVHPVVVVEATVLDRDDGGFGRIGDVGGVRLVTALVVEMGDRGAVPVGHGGGQGQGAVLVDVGEVRVDRAGGRVDGPSGTAEQGNQGCCGENSTDQDGGGQGGRGTRAGRPGRCRRPAFRCSAVISHTPTLSDGRTGASGCARPAVVSGWASGVCGDADTGPGVTYGGIQVTVRGAVVTRVMFGVRTRRRRMSGSPGRGWADPGTGASDLPVRTDRTAPITGNSAILWWESQFGGRGGPPGR